MPAISPDGRHVAFTAVSPDGIQRLWIWSTESARVQTVGATDGAVLPFWSPDSGSVAFFAGGKLKKVELNGVSPQVLADAPNGAGGSWSRNGVIIFAPASGGGLHRVAALGGASTPLTTIAPGTKIATHRRPWFLPDGEHFLFLAQETGQVASTVYVASLSDPDRASRLLTADSEAAYSSGFLIYARGPRLLAQPFDVERLQTTGEAFPIAENLPYQTDRGVYSTFSISSSGIVCYSTVDEGRKQFVWFDRAGRLVRRVGPPGLYRDFDLSPDGRRLVVARYDPDRGAEQPLAHGRRTRDAQPVHHRIMEPRRSCLVTGWPAGRLLRAREALLRHSPTGNRGKCPGQRAHGVGTDEVCGGLVGRREVHHRLSVPTAGLDLWILPTFGARQARPFLESPFLKDEPQFSPDGRWVAYNSNETGRWEAYVTSFPDAQQKFPVSTSGGIQPQWRADGRELFYLGLDGTMMSMKVDTDRGFVADVPTALFPTRLQRNSGTGQYAVTPDGQSFLLRTDVLDEPQGFTVVLNWQRLAND